MGTISVVPQTPQQEAGLHRLRKNSIKSQKRQGTTLVVPIKPIESIGLQPLRECRFGKQTCSELRQHARNAANSANSAKTIPALETLPLQHPRQPLAGVRVQIRRNFLRRSFGYDSAAGFAAFRP